MSTMFSLWQRMEMPGKRSVVLDPGHGGEWHSENSKSGDPGAVGSHNGKELRESQIVLDLANRTAAILRGNGVEVHLTRTEDSPLVHGRTHANKAADLKARAAIANSYPASVFVSIHVNATAKTDARWVIGLVQSGLAEKATREQYIQNATTQFELAGFDATKSKELLTKLADYSRQKSYDLATAIVDSLAEAVGEAKKPIDSTRSLGVLRPNHFCPATLIEVGFISNPETAENFTDDLWKGKAARGIASGIIRFFDNEEIHKFHDELRPHDFYISIPIQAIT